MALGSRRSASSGRAALGGHLPTFALNFSRPGSQYAAQYYNFLRLGFDGYHLVQQTCRDTAQWLAREIADDRGVRSGLGR